MDRDRQPVRLRKPGEFAGILPGVGGYAAQLPLLEQVPFVRQRRNIGQLEDVNACFDEVLAGQVPARLAFTF